MSRSTGSGEVIAVIPTLGRDQARLERCVTSLLESTGEVSFSILVILNDPAVELHLPSEVDIRSPGLNLGNVGALEYARSIVESEFIWMVQDDMQVDKACLKYLKMKIDADSSLALVAPITVRNGLVPAASRGGTFTDDNGLTSGFPLKACLPEDLGDTSKLDFVAGSGGLIRASALEKVGGFNLQLYPLRHGDVDLCINLKRAGLNFDLEKKAIISHDWNGSTPGILSRTLTKTNDRIIRDKIRGIENIIPISEDVDPRIINAIAQKASLLFIELAATAQSELNKYENSNYRKLIKLGRKVLSKAKRLFI